MALAAQPVFPSAAVAAVPSSSPSKEFSWLLACCSLPNNGSLPWIARLASQPPDWRHLIELAGSHGVVPQLYRQLSANTASAPASWLEKLRIRSESNTRRTLLLTRELLRVVDHLQTAGVECLPYKGAVLAQILYGDVTLRQFGDIDLIVRPRDVVKALTALSELGYKCDLALTDSQRRAYLASGYEYTFNSTHGRNVLEIQWNILPRFYAVGFDIPQFFERAIPIDIFGHFVRTLAPEDLLLALCVHAAKHAWMKLAWLCDIAELLKTQKVDWRWIQQEAERLGVERIVTVNAILAHRLLGAEIPKSIPAGRQAQKIANEIEKMLMHGKTYDPESQAYFQLMLRLRERKLDRARFLSRLALTPSTGEWSMVRLPNALSPLYRVLRFARLAGRML